MAIAKYFEGKQILVTGATGLMGKALVEKLLRCCPGVSKIYIVIRPKRGHRPEDRWTETIQSPLFDYLRNKSPESLSKVVVLAGDGGKDNFGLSEEDRNLLTENVNIVYNFAASINFFNDITRAIEMNLKSAYSLLELGLKMKKLECYVHVSTQFCHFDVRGVLNEKVYEPHLDWRTMLELIKDEKQKSALQLLESRILGGHLSTYTLTKALAEMAVKEYEKHFPTIIVRPAVVGGTANDPMPGWLDVDNFVTLYCRGVRMGVIRILPNSEDIPIESIPLDLSVNGMIVAAWKRSTLPNKECEVYCHRVEDTHRLKLKDIYNTIQISRKYPPIHTLWYNFFVCVSNPTLYKIGFFFLHIIPGILIDAALKLSGQKPRMKKIYTDIWRYNALSQYLQNPHHKFVCTNFNKLESFLSHEDKKYFSMDYSGYDFTKIITETVWTTLKYAWKENIDDEKLMAKARSRYRVLTILHYTMCAGLALFLLYLTSSLLG